MNKSDLPITDKEKKLGTEPISKLFLTLAIPSIISQIVNLLYSVVDRMYVGHISETGTISLTALGVCVPIITLISSFAQLVSSGAAPLASIQLGKGQKSQAEKILGKVFLLIPFIYVFPLFIENQVFAIIVAEPIADILSVLTTIIVFAIQFKKTLKDMTFPLKS